MDKIIDKLNEILKWEWTGLRQYAQQGFVVSGRWREVYSGMFHESAEECMKHAKIIGDKIVALGGVPTVEHVSVKQTTDLTEMLKNSLLFEQTAVKLYDEAITLADKDTALRALLEDIIIEEQDGVDELTKLLREPKEAAGDSSQKAG